MRKKKVSAVPILHAGSYGPEDHILGSDDLEIHPHFIELMTSMISTAREKNGTVQGVLHGLDDSFLRMHKIRIIQATVKRFLNRVSLKSECLNGEAKDIHPQMILFTVSSKPK